jgi:hypothetical protein
MTVIVPFASSLRSLNLLVISFFTGPVIIHVLYIRLTETIIRPVFNTHVRFCINVTYILAEGHVIVVCAIIIIIIVVVIIVVIFDTIYAQELHVTELVHELRILHTEVICGLAIISICISTLVGVVSPVSSMLYSHS